MQRNESVSKRTARFPFLVALLILWLAALPGCSSDSNDDPDGDISPDGDTDDDTDETADGDMDGDMDDDDVSCTPDTNATYVYDAPLDPKSPWPKFRRDVAQTGAAPFSLCDDGSDFWTFRTGKGIFSSPVVGGDGTVYIGSADRNFYALNSDGTERWRFETGEIIDSSALLDDQGRVYFGSGDGHLYALDAQTGAQVWSFLADDPSERNAFIRWFEGNVAIHPNGNLILGNDNWFVYAIDRNDGTMKWRFATPDQTWALPAIDAATGNIFIGNNNTLYPETLGNVFAVSSRGQLLWQTGTLATIAASPLLLDGRLILSSFDGFVRSLDTTDGSESWNLGTRDHVYSSAARHPDGFVVVPSADGTVYAIDPSDGHTLWAFDWKNPIRSSPAIDADGNIYMGTGDGSLLVLNGDGTLRWTLRLIHEDRDDVNGSPALGRTAIYIAGESGEIFGIPFDFCLRASEADNPDCRVGGAEPLDDDGIFVLVNTRYGSTLSEPPEEIAAHDPLAFSLMLREGGDTVLSLIDNITLSVVAAPEVPLEVTVSAARNFFTVYPQTPFTADENGNVTLTIRGKALVDPERTGLRFEGGTDGGDYEQSFTFKLQEGRTGSLPLPIPSAPGDAAGVWHMSRLSAPLPSLLASYNQIGFDSHHFLIGLVEGNEQQAIAYGVEVLPESDDGLLPIPDTSAIMVFEVSYDQGRIRFENNKGFTMGIQGTTIPFNLFRMTGSMDENGTVPESLTVQAVSVCGDIPLYGAFLQSFGFCHPETDLLLAWGAVLLDPWQTGSQSAPNGVGTPTFAATHEEVSVTLADSTLLGEDHSYGILLVNAEDGSSVVLDYGAALERLTDNSGVLTSVTLSFDRADVPTQVRAYLMVDTYPAAVETLTIPDAP